MSGLSKNQYVPYASLSNIEIVNPQPSEQILSAVSTDTHFISETYIRRYSASIAEFAAACEMAENFGLVVHKPLNFILNPILIYLPIT